MWARRNGYDTAAALLLSRGAKVVLDPDGSSLASASSSSDMSSAAAQATYVHCFHGPKLIVGIAQV